MTERLESLLSTILEEYPVTKRRELSNARATKILYLADWLASVETGNQISPIRWYFNRHGPYVTDLKDAAENNREHFDVIQSRNIYGSRMLRFGLKRKVGHVSDRSRQFIKRAIRLTQDLSWSEFIRLVYSTHPVMSGERYSFLDLPRAAKEYNELRSAS